MIVAGAGLLAAGCYGLRPAAGVTPELGSNVALDITDVGRAALGGQIGPAVAQVSGKLTAREGADYVLAVSSVKLLNGEFQLWKGETVRFGSDQVSTLYRRQFSPVRTLALAGVAAGAVAIFAGKVFNPGGMDPDPGPIDTALTRRGLPPVGRLPSPLVRLTPPRSH